MVLNYVSVKQSYRFLYREVQLAATTTAVVYERLHKAYKRHC